MTRHPWQDMPVTYPLTLTRTQWTGTYRDISRWSFTVVAARIIRELGDTADVSDHRTPGYRPLTLRCTAYELAVITDAVAEDGPIARAVRAIAPRD